MICFPVFYFHPHSPQATLRVVPRHQLIERTWTATPAEVRRNHVRWLQENRHIK